MFYMASKSVVLGALLAFITNLYGGELQVYVY